MIYLCASQSEKVTSKGKRGVLKKYCLPLKKTYTFY